MAKDSFEQPTDEQLTGFVAGDPIAIDSVVRLLLPQVTRWALKYHSDLPEDEVQSTVNLVFAETCRRHSRYSPHKSKLTTYIIHLLKLRLSDLYHDASRVALTADADLDVYEKLLQLPYNYSTTTDAATRLSRTAFFEEAALMLEDYERDFLELIRKGEKRQEVFVAVLARYRRPLGSPEHEVKNTKERLTRRLRAIAKELGYDPQDLLSE